MVQGRCCNEMSCKHHHCCYEVLTWSALPKLSRFYHKNGSVSAMRSTWSTWSGSEIGSAWSSSPKLSCFYHKNGSASGTGRTWSAMGSTWSTGSTWSGSEIGSHDDETWSVSPIGKTSMSVMSTWSGSGNGDGSLAIRHSKIDAPLLEMETEADEGNGTETGTETGTEAVEGTETEAETEAETDRVCDAQAEPQVPHHSEDGSSERLHHRRQSIPKKSSAQTLHLLDKYSKPAPQSAVQSEGTSFAQTTPKSNKKKKQGSGNSDKP